MLRGTLTRQESCGELVKRARRDGRPVALVFGWKYKIRTHPWSELGGLTRWPGSCRKKMLSHVGNPDSALTQLWHSLPLEKQRYPVLQMGGGVTRIYVL